MNGNAELLNFIYQNSQMGVDTVKQIIDITEDEPFSKTLKAQFKEYHEIYEEAQDLLNENGYDEKGIGALEKIKVYLMINLQTLMDKSTSHIAEMMMIGSNMGIIDAIKNLRKYEGAEHTIINLMKKLKKLEENNWNELKAYL